MRRQLPRRPASSVSDSRSTSRVSAVLGEVLEPRNLQFALAPHRVVLRKPLDQPLDPVADLKGEVRRGGPRPLPAVLDGPRPGQSIRSLGLTHFFFPFCVAGGGSPSRPPGWATPPLTVPWPAALPIGASSASSSTSACTWPPIAVASPISQMWLYTARVGSVA